MNAKQLKFFDQEDDKNSSKRRIIALPLDTLILLLVVIALLFILFFSLGIEKGRSLASFGKQQQKMSSTSEALQLNLSAHDLKVDALTESVEVKPPRNLTGDISSKVTASPKIQREEKKESAGKRYAIQVISCSKELPAQEEAKKLQKQGFPVYVAKKSNFFAVYAGTFKEKAEAEKNLSLLRKTYKDCILRTIE